ncbi:hypothetical protein [Actinoplanes sp. OR16]|uniref:CdiA C-terminal domain-containing protein n=1 Tax=Actinoplanes sp. OR16 TaxID=946334 RepID=UPI000FDA6378|nr:hypothetical protein [Actinoplanes sp. OR16]
MTSPLVAQPVDSTTGITGLGLIEDIQETVSGIENGSWIDASLGGAGVSLEALSLVLDPLGGIASWGVGWLMEHVAPLREALDHLAGDADQVAAHAATWENVAASMRSARETLLARVDAGTADWFGASADAYRTHATSQAATVEGIAVAAGGIASAVMGTGLLVSLVREIVRDLIADFVATLALRLPQWLAAEGLTLGLATPVVAGQVASLVAEWANRIRHFIRGLLDSLRDLIPRTDRLSEYLSRFKMDSAGAGPGKVPGGSGSTVPSLPPDPGRRPRGRAKETHPTRKKDRGLRRENESADILSRHGYDVEQNPPPKANRAEPDYRIEGEYFDCYAPETDDLDNMRTTFSNKVRRQADRLILFVDDTPRSVDDIADMLKRKPLAGLKEILVVRDGKVEPFYPFAE